MESTGDAGRIHCSADFVQNLIVNEINHGIRVESRADPVEAKGKGLMKTFWIDDSPIAYHYEDPSATEQDSDSISQTIKIKRSAQVESKSQNSRTESIHAIV